MKFNLLIFLVSSMVSCTPHENTLNWNYINEKFIYWEDLNSSEKDEILKTFSIDENAINYYNGKFSLSDNDNITSLLDIITSNVKHKEIACFYFYIFNQICLQADGEMSEIIGKYCQKMVINNPSYVFNYFARNEGILQIYASLIGYELYFKEEGTSDIEYNFKDFKKIVEEKAIPKETYSKIIKEFLEQIEISMKNTD